MIFPVLRLPRIVAAGPNLAALSADSSSLECAGTVTSNPFAVTSSNSPMGSSRWNIADGSKSGVDGGAQELDNASTQKTREVFTVGPAEMRGELNRSVSATGGRGRPNLERNPNGMAFVAEIAKSVNTNRQEVRLAW